MASSSMGSCDSIIITLGRVGELTPGAAGDVGLTNRKPATTSSFHLQLDELKLQYDSQVEENNKLQEKLTRLEGNIGKENAQRQRIQTLEGMVKGLTERNQYLERKLEENEGQLRASYEEVDGLILIVDPVGRVKLESSTVLEPRPAETDTREMEDDETQEINPAEIPQMANEIGDADVTTFANFPVLSSPTDWTQPHPVPHCSSRLGLTGNGILQTSTDLSSAAPPPSGRKGDRPFRSRRTPRKKIVSQPETRSILACNPKRRPPPRPSFSSTPNDRVTKERHGDGQREETPRGIYHWEVRKASFGDYRCGCGQMFGHRYNLDRHIRWYNEEFKFPCGSCEKRFFSSYHLSRHLRSHKQDAEPSANLECHGFGTMLPSLQDLGAQQVATRCDNPPPPLSTEAAAAFTVTSESV